jgi:ADP-ribosyl-[dinitrogen reductase] hydrolase
VIERFRGCLLGLAAGDALGTTLEFKPPGSFDPILDLNGGGPFGLAAGEWTDDTSMALCLAESLIESGGFDPVDHLERYLGWYQHGHLSSTGTCFDIGNTVRASLERFMQKGEAYPGSTDPSSAGNGSLMRLAPVPMFFARDAAAAIERSGDSSRTTHGAAAAVDACRYFGALLYGALNGTPKEKILSPNFTPISGYWQSRPLIKEIDEIAAGSYKLRNPPQIIGSGYVVRSLEAALWAFFHSNSFKEGALMAVNLGNDADTTGAIYGQLAGAVYGEGGIPVEWREKLAMGELIESYADELFRLAYQDEAGV